MRFALVYDMHTAQPIVNTIDLGNHQTNELADGTMTIATNTIDMAEYNFEALGSVRLDPDELYNLYAVLHVYFMTQGGKQP